MGEKATIAPDAARGADISAEKRQPTLS